MSIRVERGSGGTLDYNSLNNKPTPFNIYETEIDFGTKPVYDKTFVISNALSTPSSKIIAYPSGNIATGRVGNDLEWDSISYGAIASTGSFTLTATCSNGSVVGKRKVYYSIL